ncbi:helix-turn-helix domain-containing protein [Granulosicoccus sp. 3-233]|uniref:helix-turn-helix domain-containing protein n=1 Tax=Granulosicoccus sp. 3-233 TaxID=3417969 RepID=UPI003D34CCA3
MITPDFTQPVTPMLDELSTEDFLQVVGQRVRQQRARKSMSRKRLAEVSTVSERYLAQLESGQGNMSIALLRKVTSAIGISMGALMSEEVTETCFRKASPVQKDERPEPASAAHQQDCAKQHGGLRENIDLSNNRRADESDSRHSSNTLHSTSSAETADI